MLFPRRAYMCIAMKFWSMILLCIALVVSSGVNASAHTELHLAHSDLGDAYSTAGSDISYLHKIVHPHNRADHDQHHHDFDDQDSDEENHGHDDHAAHCNGYAIEAGELPQRAKLWSRAPIAFETDPLVPAPLYLAEHIPD